LNRVYKIGLLTLKRSHGHNCDRDRLVSKSGLVIEAGTLVLVLMTNGSFFQA